MCCLAIQGLLLGTLLGCSRAVAGCGSGAVFGCIAWIVLATLSECCDRMSQFFDLLGALLGVLLGHFVGIPGLSLGLSLDCFVGMSEC